MNIDGTTSHARRILKPSGCGLRQPMFDRADGASAVGHTFLRINMTPVIPATDLA
jgi:hypothetical protein